MPEKKAEAAIPATAAVAGTPAKEKKPRKPRVDMKACSHLVCVGSGVKLFAKNLDEVKAYIAAAPVNKQAKITVFAFVPLKVQTKIEI